MTTNIVSYCRFFSFFFSILQLKYFTGFTLVSLAFYVFKMLLYYCASYYGFEEIKKYFFLLFIFKIDFGRTFSESLYLPPVKNVTYYLYVTFKIYVF